MIDKTSLKSRTEKIAWRNLIFCNLHTSHYHCNADVLFLCLITKSISIMEEDIFTGESCCWSWSWHWTELIRGLRVSGRSKLHSHTDHCCPGSTIDTGSTRLYLALPCTFSSSFIVDHSNFFCQLLIYRNYHKQHCIVVVKEIKIMRCLQSF